MTKLEIEKKVVSIIATKFSADPDKIHGETNLANDLGVDSFGAVEMMFELEAAFSLSIPDSEIAHIRTVNHIVDYIYNWLEKQSGAKE